MGSKAGARAMLARRDTVRLTGSHAAPVVALAVFCLGLCAIVWIGVLVLFELDRRPVDGRGPWETSSLAYATAGGMSLLILLAAVGLLRIMRRQVDAAEAAREREARYRATFDQASVGIAHTAMDGRFREVNERLCEMLGYSADELQQKTLFEITHPEDAAGSHELREYVLAGGRGREFEKRYLRKDGSALWVVVTASIVRKADGSPDYYISLVQDITGRKEAERRLLRQAHFDAVTGLPNRTLCFDRLGHALRQAERRAEPMAVLFVDLDRFKNVNDTLGHGAGDALLREIARRLAGCVREADTVARMGGDEFAVILSELARPEHARLIGQKIVAAVAAPVDLDGQEVFVSASVGIATYPDDGADGATLLKHADAAMLRAKQLGKNNFQFYAPSMNDRAQEKFALENDLRRALERGEFCLHYQPRADLKTGLITGMEALLRWQRPGKGLESPAAFIPLLEETGLIVEVGAWVLHAACAQIRAWQDAGLPPVPVAVNLSPKQFLRHDVCATIRQALKESRVDPSQLEVELTESELMRNPEEVAEVLGQLRVDRIRVAVDDFGTGYSSLAYLKRFPLDALKLDRAFVKGLPSSTDDASIATAVISMAHSLGLHVIAEGVETSEQRDFLAASGCDEMQGYLLSRPLPPADCVRLLERSVFGRIPLRRRQ